MCHHAAAPAGVHADQGKVVEAAGELEQEPIVAVVAADAEELPPLHFEIKCQCSGGTQRIVAHLLERFVLENALGHEREGVDSDSASAYAQERARGAQGEGIVERF